MSLSLTAKKGTKETLGAELHSLNNSMAQPNRVNSVFVKENVNIEKTFSIHLHLKQHSL